MSARNAASRLIAAALALLLLSALPASAAEFIRSFDSDVRVAKDGELTVTETIRVRAEHSAIRHGIFRDFPLIFQDAAGNRHEVTFSILSLTRDGYAEPYHTERMHDFVRIFAGSKDELVSYGEHTYVLRYRTGRQVRWFDGKPELNWNVTGNFWNFPIYAARYSLHLPGNARVTRWTAYTGRLGARGIDWTGGIGANGVLSVQTTQVLYSGEGLTVVAELPDAAVEAPNAQTQLWYALFDYRRWIFGSVGFLMVLGYYFAAWEAVGRDPKRGTIIPLFHPPEGVSPALANYIRDWGFGREKWRAFTAACLSLAVRGLVHLKQTGKTLTLEKTGNQPDGGFEKLPAGERAIYSWVNEMGAATIDQAHGERVDKVGKEFTTSIERENRNRFFRRNLGFVVVGLVITALVLVNVFVFGGLADEDVGLILALGAVGFIGTLFLVQILHSPALVGATLNGIVRVLMSIVFFIFLVSFVLNILQGMFHGSASEALPMVGKFVEDYPFPLVLVTTFAALNGLFVYLLRAPTALGRPIMDQLSGFRLYLETAEADRLNLRAPELTPERFETLLPYAVALDVEKPWAHAFEASLRRAHPDDPDPMRHYSPRWTSGGSSWSGGDFGGGIASAVGGMAGAFASAVPASSGSSGFGGGGGSGGGGGGGGGGGW